MGTTAQRIWLAGFSYWTAICAFRSGAPGNIPIGRCYDPVVGPLPLALAERPVPGGRTFDYRMGTVPLPTAAGVGRFCEFRVPKKRAADQCQYPGHGDKWCCNLLCSAFEWRLCWGRHLLLEEKGLRP